MIKRITGAVALTAAVALILTGGLTATALHGQNTNQEPSSNRSRVTTMQNANSNSNSNMNRNMNSGRGQGAGMAMGMNSEDRRFMMEAAMGGMAEVEAARLALQKSSMDSVKQYAQRMIDDHTRAGDELKSLATTKGIALPTQLDAKHMSMMARLQRESGMKFDQTYVKEMGVKAHEKMEKLFMRETMRGMDADAKAFASKTLPAVQMHLQMAREMTTSMKSMRGMGSMNSNMSNTNMN